MPPAGAGRSRYGHVDERASPVAAGTDHAARVSAAVAARGPGGRRHRGGVPGPPGHGLCGRGRPAAGNRPVGSPAGVGLLRGARLVTTGIPGPGVNDRADDRSGHRAAGGRQPRALRGAGRDARAAGRFAGRGRLAGAAGFHRRPAVTTGPCGLPGRGGTHHDRRATRTAHRRPGHRGNIHPPGGLVHRPDGARESGCMAHLPSGRVVTGAADRACPPGRHCPVTGNRSRAAIRNGASRIAENCPPSCRVRWTISSNRSGTGCAAVSQSGQPSAATPSRPHRPHT